MEILIAILWALLIGSAFLPMIQQRMLEAARLRLMEKLEKKRRSRVIALIHRQEQMTLLGFPIMRYITIDDSEEVLRAIRLTPADTPIDLILHTPGGLVLAAEQIAFALKKHPGKITVFVPHYAMSGGTLIALAADEICMDENAVLGPVDPQIGTCPAASILRAVKMKSVNELDDQTLIMADIAEKALNQVRQFVACLLGDKMDAERAQQIAEALTDGRWTHDYPITCEQAKELGLPITTDMPEEVYMLMNLYPQQLQRRPTVQYIPLPYQPHPMRRDRTAIGFTKDSDG
ncbi:MAG: hypothetical protein RMK18_08105 [Armatimonadota bacterium]|nr:hypothetical protein [Armatimonadota bacterium]MCX7776734.1 hypothetical protein [Armatimonadota bacterium]MDW8025803.1 hypothetical protein [Armatimonadota bacterium]